MRSLITAALLLTTTPTVAQLAPDLPILARCKPADGLVDYKSVEPARPRTLAEMPPAVEIKALWRVVDGCPKPIVVRRGLGNPSETKTPAPDAPPRPRTLR